MSRMKINFLGTSAGWPLPRLGCDCYICQSKDPKDKRLRPSVLLNDSVLIDASPDIYHQLERLDKTETVVKNFKALIITHCHPDHVLGFYDLTHLYNRIEFNPKIIATQEVINGFRQFYKYPLRPFNVQIVKHGEVFNLGGMNISFFPVVHSRIPCFGVKIKQGKIFIYIPDIKKLPKSEYKTCSGVHLLSLDGSSLGKEGQTKIHESIEDGVKLAKILKPIRCYFTHIGHKTGKQTELENYLQNRGRNFHVAYDGLEIEL